MRRFLAVCGLVVLAGCIMVAQEVPLAEVYGGFQFNRVSTQSQINSFTASGGIASFQYNINKNFGVVAELGGTTNGSLSVHGPGYPVDQTQFNYLFGPRVFVNKAGRFSPFFEFLVGGIHNSRSFSIPNSVIPANPVISSGVTREVGATTTKFRTTQNAYAMGFGGGLDIRINKLIAVRPAQLDYLPSHFSPLNVPGVPSGTNDTNWQHNLRYSTGILFRFGSTGR